MSLKNLLDKYRYLVLVSLVLVVSGSIGLFAKSIFIGIACVAIAGIYIILSERQIIVSIQDPYAGVPVEEFMAAAETPSNYVPPVGFNGHLTSEAFAVMGTETLEVGVAGSDRYVSEMHAHVNSCSACAKEGRKLRRRILEAQLNFITPEGQEALSLLVNQAVANMSTKH